MCERFPPQPLVQQTACMRGLHPLELDLEQITRHTEGLADLVASNPLTTPVPTCGEWTLADLAYHLFEVQHFWVHIIEGRPAGPETYERPSLPADGLEAALRATCERLVGALSDADLDEPAWSWSDDHTVGFTVRRQIHEALVHHIDGVLAVAAALPPVPGALAADGIDELVDVMLTGIPDWAIFLPAIQVVRLRTTDTDDRWTMSLGHVSGTSSQTGVTYDGLPAAERLGDDMAPDLVIEGSSLDLLLWLWGRTSIDALSLEGDATIAEALRETVASATQ